MWWQNEINNKKPAMYHFSHKHLYITGNDSGQIILKSYSQDIFSFLTLLLGEAKTSLIF